MTDLGANLGEHTGNSPWLNPGMPFFTLYTKSKSKISQYTFPQSVAPPLDVSDERTIQLVPHYLRGFEHYLTGSEDAQYSSLSLSLFDANWDVLENMILPSRDEISYEYGWVHQDGAKITHGVRRGTIIEYNPRFTYQGGELNLKIVDVGVPKGAVNTYRRSFENNRPVEGFVQTMISLFGTNNIGEVVKYIASEMGMKSDVEPTEGDNLSIQQNNETNHQFLVKLSKLATSKSGISDYKMQIEGDTLIFKTKQALTQDRKIVRRYFYAKSAASTLLEYSPNVNWAHILLSGAVRILGSGWDPLGKTLILAEATRENTERLAIAKETFDIIQQPQEGEKKDAGRMYVLPYPDPAYAKAFTKNKFERFAEATVEATARVVGDPYLKPYDFVEIIVLKDDGKVHYTSGVYWILNIKHTMQAGNFVTDLSLVTDGVRTADLVNRGVKADFRLNEERFRGEGNSTLKQSKLEGT